MRTGQLDPTTGQFYLRALETLREAGIPVLVGGAYAFERYTRISRHTKDFDLFVHPDDCARVLGELGARGYRVELPFPHWLGKARCGPDLVDIIFGAGNGVARVDDGWFRHAVEDEILGIPVRLCPVEETIWSKAFIMERERFDGADVAHLLRARAEALDWHRLLRRFGPHWRVLLTHLVLFGFVYPCERRRIPPWVMHQLTGRLEAETDGAAPEDPVCQGTLLSREQYLTDLADWGYQDARLAPRGPLSPDEVARWTADIPDAQDDGHC